MLYKYNNKGFTLLELVVSIAIFGTIAGVVIANLRGGSLRSELVLGATNLTEAIREAHTRTVAGELVGGVLPLGGFGVYLSSGSPGEYALFADLNGDLAFGAGEEVRRTKFTLSGSVTVQSMSPMAGNSLTITFRQPKPTPYINGATADSSADIILRHKFLTDTKTVHFERVSGAVGTR